MAAPVTQSVNRYQRDEYRLVRGPAASGFQINEGDGVAYMSGAFYPISAIPMASGNDIQNWPLARVVFAGVSLTQHNSTDVKSGSVTAISQGTFHFPLVQTSGTLYQAGTSVSFSSQNSSGYLHPQILIQCSGPTTGTGVILDQFTSLASGAASEATVYLNAGQFHGYMISG